MNFLACLIAGSLCLAASEPRVLDTQVDQLARQITGGLEDGRITTLAVLEFPSLDGSVSGLGRYVAEELTTRLFRTGRFKLVERQLLTRVLEEQKLAASGFLDEATASRLGRLLGVDVLAAGTVADLDTSVKVHARLIASETGAVVSVGTVSVPMTRELEKLLDRRPAAGDAGRFDGAWEVDISCMAQGAQAYANRFPASVKDGVLHGQLGVEGGPGSLTVDGRIAPDGNGTLLATGVTGDPRFTLRKLQKGRHYSFPIEVIFSGTSGTGRRQGPRPCTITFTRKGRP